MITRKLGIIPLLLIRPFVMLGKVANEKRNAMRGMDGEGKFYENIDTMWEEEVTNGTDPASRDKWYKKQIEYWDVRHAM